MALEVGTVVRVVRVNVPELSHLVGATGPIQSVIPGAFHPYQVDSRVYAADEIEEV